MNKTNFLEWTTFYSNVKKSILNAVLICFFSISNSQARTVLIYDSDSIVNTKLSVIIQKGFPKSSQPIVVPYQKNQINELLEKVNDKDSLISLGSDPNLAVKIFQDSGLNSNIIYGAHAVKTDQPGISLLIEPQALLSTLTQAAPKIKRIVTVVTESYDTKHLKLFQENAKQLGIKFEYDVVSTPVELAKNWKKKLDGISKETDAILMLDPTFMDTIGGLKYILKNAWKKKIIVGTTIAKYSKRGVSIGIFQDFEKYGESLYEYLRGSKKQPVYMSNYSPVLNTRSLSHNGILVKKLDFNSRVVFLK